MWIRGNQSARGTADDVAGHVIERCLAKGPAARYQSADDLRSDLMSIARGRWAPVVTHAWHAARARIARATALGALGGLGFLLTANPLSQTTGRELRMPGVPTLAVLPLENVDGKVPLATFGAQSRV